MAPGHILDHVLELEKLVAHLQQLVKAHVDFALAPAGHFLDSNVTLDESLPVPFFLIPDS